MRIIVLLAITLIGGVVGLFAGVHLYDLSHPIRTDPGGASAGTPYGSLQSAHRGVADALERQAGRHKWLVGGTLIGAGVGFFGTVLASRAGREGGGRWRPDSDAAV